VSSGEWTLKAVVRHGPKNKIVWGKCGENYLLSVQKCDLCNSPLHRRFTYIVENTSGDIKQLGSTCVSDFIDEAILEEVKFKGKNRLRIN